MEENISQTQSVIESEPRPARPWLKIAGSGLVGLLLAAGLVWAGVQIGRSQVQHEILQPIPTSIPVVVLTPTLPPGTFPTTVTPLTSELTSTPDPTANWKTYKNEEYRFTLEYSKEWFLESDTHVFEEGDLFSIRIVGKTQKPQTEFYDGASLTIGVPIKTDKNIKTWVKDYYPAKNVNDEPNEFSEETIGILTFQKVYTCGLGCFTYYNVKKNESVYRIMIFAAGPDEVKYSQTLAQMLSTFRFLE